MSGFGRRRNFSRSETLHCLNATDRNQERAVMHRHVEGDDWRTADRFDPLVWLTSGLGIVVATVLANVM
jgi:hypothetical protein